MKSRSAASAQWRSSKTRTVGASSAIRSKKSRQAAKRSSRSRCGVLQPQQVRESRLDPLALLRVRGRAPPRRRELRSGGFRILVLGDPGASAHHLGQRPVRDALAVGETAPSCHQTSSTRPSTYLSNSHRAATCRSRRCPMTRRDAPGAPRRMRGRAPSAARSSRSRPTNGASRPPSAPPAAARPREAPARAGPAPPCP